MSQCRIIKKYPNRRLYDTQESRYITLAEIRQLVIEEAPFMVIDQRTGDDITRCVLLQVITEQESDGESILTQEFLFQMIRAYSRRLSGFAGLYLEQSLRLLLRNQHELRARLAEESGQDSASAARDAADRTWNGWLRLQQQFLQGLAEPEGAGSEVTNPREDESEARYRQPRSR